MSDAKEKKARRVAEELERLKIVYEMVMTGQRQAMGRILVLATRDGDGLEELLPDRFENGRTRPAGVYYRSWAPWLGPAGPIQSDVIVLRADASKFGIVYHEYVHALTARSMPMAPLWLSEGLSEFWATLERRGDKIVIGRHSDHHLRALRGLGFLPIDELLAVDHSSKHYNENSRAGKFYAESWILVHFLLTNDQRRPALDRYVGLVNGGADHVSAGRSSFGDLEKLEKELRNYARKSGLKFFELPLERLPTPEIELRKLSKIETKVRLAEFHARRRAFELAEPLVEEVLAAAPELASAHEVAAMVPLFRQEREAAGERYAQAAEHEGASHEAHYYHAMLNLGDDEKTAERERHLQKAVEKRSDFAPALLALAVEVPAPKGELESVRQAVWKAVQADPGSARAWLWLARVEAVMGDAKQSAQVGRKAVQISVVSGNGALNNNVCWYLSVSGSSAVAMPACEAAVRLVPESGSFRDSRGVARALTGDREGAIEDFRAFIGGAEDDEEGIAERERWIQLLEEGKSPFDADTLAGLRGGRF